MRFRVEVEEFKAKLTLLYALIDFVDKVFGTSVDLYMNPFISG